MRNLRRATLVVVTLGALVATPLAGDFRVAAHPAERDLRAIAVDYLDALYVRDFERVERLLAPDAFFSDPTAAPLAGVTEYVRRGASTIVNEFRGASERARDSGYTIRRWFVTGEYVVMTMGYASVLRGDDFGRPDLWIPIAVDGTTVLRIVDGEVVEHLDHIDYDAMLAQTRAYAGGAGPAGLQPARADPVLTAARTFLDTLYAYDFDALAPLTAAELTLRDPTTALLGPPLHHEGRDAVLASYQSSTEGTRKAGFDVVDAFTSGSYAVFTLDYRLEVRGDVAGVDREWVPLAVPGTTIIRVVDGRVAEHLDHVDYRSMLEQIAAFREPRGDR